MGHRKKNWSDDPRRYAPHHAWVFDAVLKDGAVFEYRDGVTYTLARVSRPVERKNGTRPYTMWTIEYLEDGEVKSWSSSWIWIRDRSWALKDESDWILAQITGGYKRGQVLG